jgi:nuclear pore complex protein Nup155
MKPLLDHTVEVMLALWKFVCDHQLHLLDPSISAIMWKSLKPTVFRDLTLFGSDTCISLINHYLVDAAGKDAIRDKLSKVCPSLFRIEVTFNFPFDI